MRKAATAEARELNRENYQAQKDRVFRQYVRRRAILNTTHAGPPRYVSSPLLRWMMNDAVIDRGAVVVYATRGQGKSTAAQFLLQHSIGGVMFGDCQRVASGNRYWQGVVEAIGLSSNGPSELDPSWERLLIDAVVTAKHPSLQPHAKTLEGALDGRWSLCGANSEDYFAFEPPPRPPEDFYVALLQQQAVIVLDDFGSVHDDDHRFIERFSIMAHHANILVLVLANEKATADRLISIRNGCVSPLECNYCMDAEVPGWVRPRWTTEDLRALVRSRYGGRFDLSLVFGALRENENQNAADVLERFAAVYGYK